MVGMQRAVAVGMVVAGLAASGCTTCVRFNDLAPGTTFSAVGTSFASNGQTMTTEQFFWGNGQPSTSGSVNIDSNNYPQGGGNALRFNNMSVRFPTGSAKWIKMKFADLGGNTNVTVNGERRNVGRLITLNGQMIGGQQVTVTGTQSGNNWIGEFKVEGDITSFSMGGQELWVDDVCWRR